MAWYEFPGATMTRKRAAFLAWHNAACTAEGIPRPGRNAATGELALDECWTDAYAEPRWLSDGRLVVQLDNDDLHAVRLMTTAVEPADIEGEGVVTLPERKTLPRTWEGRTVTRTADNREP